MFQKISFFQIEKKIEKKNRPTGGVVPQGGLQGGIVPQGGLQGVVPRKKSSRKNLKKKMP